MQGISSITGSISSMPLTSLVLYQASRLISGQISTTSRLTRLYTFYDEPITIPIDGLIFGSNLTEIYFCGTGSSALSPAQVDALLIAASAATWTGVKTLSAAWENAAHTSASNSAITTLTTIKGVTVTVN